MARGVETTAHKAQVQRLIRRGAETRRFRARVSETYFEDEKMEWVWCKPDAFVLTGDVLKIYEVEVTSVAHEEKLDAYADLWFALDCRSVGCELVLIDRHGTEVPVDLCARWYQNMLDGEAAA